MSLKNAYANIGLHMPTFHLQPPYHPFSPEDGGLIHNAYHTVAVPLPKGRPGQPGPFHSGSIGWGQFDDTYEHTQYFKGIFQMFAHALELKGLGTPVFKAQRGSNSVRESQIAFWHLIEGRLLKTDKPKLATNVMGKGIGWELYFDQSVAEVLRGLSSGTYDMELGRADQSQADRNQRHHNNVDGGEGEIVDGYNVDAPHGDRAARRRPEPGVDPAEQEEEMAEEENMQDAIARNILDQHLADLEGQEIMEKVKVIVHHLTRPAVDVVTGEPILDKETGLQGEEDAGCIVFFFVMDPLYSIGKALSKLVEMCEEYKNVSLGMQSTGGSTTDSDAVNGHGGGDGGGAGKRPGPGGGGGGGGSGKASTKLAKQFPWIGGEEHKNNTLLLLDRAQYLKYAAFAADRPELYIGQERQVVLARGMENPGTLADPNPIHPIHLFTPEWACKIMNAFGVPEDRCSIEFFTKASIDVPPAQQLDDMLNNEQPHRPVEWINWFMTPDKSYWYLQEAWTYYRNGRAGLMLQYFPWVEIPDTLMKLTAVRTETNEMTRYDRDDKNGIAKEFTKAMIVQGLGEREPLPVIPYDPYAMTRKNVIFCMSQENSAIMGEIRCPIDPEANPAAYSDFCSAMEINREACLMRMRQVLIPSKHVPETVNEILKFMGKEVRKVGVFLPMFTMDPSDTSPDVYPLDPFAHYMARQAMHVKHHLHVVSETRHWQFVHHGAQDCHATQGVSVHVSAIYHGPPMTGKSYMVKSATVSTCIPGTVNTMQESSNRSFNTHDDFVNWIVFKDEVDNIYVDGKAAEKDTTGKAERLKTMLTDHKATYRVLTFVDQANGRQRRVGEDIESLFHATMFCCTNKKVSLGDEAISSRFLNFVMTRSDAVLSDYLGIKNLLTDEDSKVAKDMVKSWRVKQCLLCLAQILIDSKILPEPSMDVFDVIQQRMLSYLGFKGVSLTEIRIVHMMKRLARIYTILNAILLVWDVPGAEHSLDEFDLGHLLDLLPFLYCTKQIAIFAITQLSETIIRPSQTICLLGAMKFTGFPYTETRTIEDYIKNDKNKTIKWKIESTGHINPNYLCLKGKYGEVLLNGIAANCKPHLTSNEVAAELDSLSKFYFPAHPVANIDPTAWHAADDKNPVLLPRKKEMAPLQAVIRNWTDDELYIAVEAINHLKDDVVLQALHMCIHDNFTPQRIMIGVHPIIDNPKDVEEQHHLNELYRVLTVDARVIERFSVGKTIRTKNVAYMPPSVMDIMGGTRLDPDKQESGERYDMSGRSNMQREIVEDLDDYGNKMHHFRSGCRGDPADSRARQVAIYEWIRRAVLANDDLHNKEGTLLLEHTPPVLSVEGADPMSPDGELLDNRGGKRVALGQPSLLMEYPMECIFEIQEALEKSAPKGECDAITRQLEASANAALQKYLALSPEDRKQERKPIGIAMVEADREMMLLHEERERRINKRIAKNLNKDEFDGDGDNTLVFDDLGLNSEIMQDMIARAQTETEQSRRIAMRKTLAEKGNTKKKKRGITAAQVLGRLMCTQSTLQNDNNFLSIAGAAGLDPDIVKGNPQVAALLTDRLVHSLRTLREESARRQESLSAENPEPDLVIAPEDRARRIDARPEEMSRAVMEQYGRDPAEEGDTGYEIDGDEIVPTSSLAKKKKKKKKAIVLSSKKKKGKKRSSPADDQLLVQASATLSWGDDEQ